jgi:hypothetical protein
MSRTTCTAFFVRRTLQVLERRKLLGRADPFDRDARATYSFTVSKIPTFYSETVESIESFRSRLCTALVSGMRWTRSRNGRVIRAPPILTRAATPPLFPIPLSLESGCGIASCCNALS